jgi:hypothetical protein
MIAAATRMATCAILRRFNIIGSHAQVSGSSSARCRVDIKANTTGDNRLYRSRAVMLITVIQT